MIRRRLLLLAAPLCVVVVAASVAFASTPDTEHSSDAKLDHPHAERPVAASNRLDGVLGSLTPGHLRAALQYKAGVQVALAQLAYTDSLAAAAAAGWVEATAEASVAAWVDATAEAAASAARPAPVYRSGGGGGAGGSLACIRAHESDSAGGYQAVSPNGTYRGAYQFLQSTWNSSAAAAGRGDLVGLDPATVSPADQDAIAAYLYSQAGSGPWGGGC
ncbi:MAG TPA: transglycosylase family protein [Acidimicrobiia bacterium]|nr:transglycosylase family protein [Acidimicrobiia bacterium]